MVSPNGAVAFNYRKTFLYKTDEAWGCSEPPTHTYGSGHAFPLTGTITIAGSHNLRTQVGICMDLNPYKFESPFEDFEFATAAKKNRANLILMPTAWLHPDSPDIMETRPGGEEGEVTDEYRRDRLSKLLKEQDPTRPNMSTVNYWATRMMPFLREEETSSNRRAVAMAICNRSGVEDLVMYAGSSSIFTLDSPASQNPLGYIYHGSLGEAEESLLYTELDIDE